jgi:hypothetical protein
VPNQHQSDRGKGQVTCSSGFDLGQTRCVVESFGGRPARSQRRPVQTSQLVSSVVNSDQPV